MRRRGEPRLIVLMSTSELAARTNPYATMLTSSLNERPDILARSFSWTFALAGRWDVLHLHWPESRLRGRTVLRTWAQQLLFTVVLVRSRLLRRPIVRTVHNVELPTGLARRERWILRLVERRTAWRIRLNEATPVPPGPSSTIKHGHYRGWFAGFAVPPSVPGRIAFVGLIRRYKAVPELVSAFSAVDGECDLTLHVSGHPSSRALSDALIDAAYRDPRVTLVLRRIEDAELVREIGEAELVVLPYPEMHNSGAVLTSLSLGRPVLVPDNEVNRALAAEVGPGWLYTFEPPLSGADLATALARVRADERAVPDLDSRDWNSGAAAHAAVYRNAVASVSRQGSMPVQ